LKNRNNASPSSGETIPLLDSNGSAPTAISTAGVGWTGGAVALPEAIKLLIGVGGIYSAFLYYGSLQEDVFRYTAADGITQFKQAWFLQVLESLANVGVGFIGMRMAGMTPNIPLKQFAVSGAAQVTAKAGQRTIVSRGDARQVWKDAARHDGESMFGWSFLHDPRILASSSYHFGHSDCFNGKEQNERRDEFLSRSNVHCAFVDF
jgi:hypothetical protein